MSVNSGPGAIKKLLERRDSLMSFVSLKGLIWKPKLHERTAYRRLKRSEKVDSTMYCQHSVVILGNVIIK